MVAIFNRILSKVAAFRRQRRHRLDEEQAYGNEKKDAVFNPVFNKDAVIWFLITLKIKEIVDAKVFNKDAVIWFLITLKIKEIVDANLKKSPSPQDKEWVGTIRGKLAEARAEAAVRPSARPSVYRVPKSLSEGDERAAYRPQVVSIGPLHAGKPRLLEMERHKWRTLHHVLKRTRHHVTAFLYALRPMEDRVRACYDGGVAGMPSNEFVQCLVLDGTFVLEVFRATLHGYLPHDPIFAIRGVMHAVRSDMILLENQIPLFVLDLLLRIQRHPKQTDVVASLAVRFFDPLMPHRKYRCKLESSVDVNAAAVAAFDPLSDPMLHCLDVFRRSFFRAGLQPTPPPAAGARLKKSSWPPPRVADKRRQQFVHCVSELREAGIQCQRRNMDWFWDIKFEKGVLHIPRILIHHSTKALFLNLIAFEQCHCHLDIATPEGTKITAYAIFMDNLINSAEDVKYLHDRGIIEHKLGSNAEVADLFNRLCLQVVFDINDSYLSNLSKDVTKYYDDKWSTWVASLRHNYFTNPWKIISIVAGVFLLLFTMMQTFYSAYSYYRPPA